MSPLLEEMPDRAEEYSVPLEKGDAERAGGYIILDITPKTRPAEFARTSLSAWGLQTPLSAFSCTCNAAFLTDSCVDG